MLGEIKIKITKSGNVKIVSDGLMGSDTVLECTIDEALNLNFSKSVAKNIRKAIVEYRIKNEMKKDISKTDIVKEKAK